jgi:hypothetical protein
MGNLLSLLKPQSKDAEPIDFAVDFKALPNGQEAHFALVKKLIDESKDVLNSIQTYAGCGEFIRKVRLINRRLYPLRGRRTKTLRMAPCTPLL